MYVTLDDWGIFESYLHPTFDHDESPPPPPPPPCPEWLASRWRKAEAAASGLSFPARG
jgi:hypothetical protein